MQELLDFLYDLRDNNNREWFHANIDRYRRVQAAWDAFALRLLDEVSLFDPSVAGLTLRDITYRIYRDTRFSADKSPYKTHFGVFIAPGGKRTMHSGYYFHIGVGGPSDYTEGHMLCCGNYCYDREVLAILREDIADDWDAFCRYVLAPADPRFQPMMDEALKKVPKPYSADAPYADWMRMKMFGVQMNVDNAFILAPDLAKRVAALFAGTLPLNDFINRAIDYVHP